MSDNTFQVVAIGLYFAGMLAIGFYAYRRTSDLDDYMLGGRRLPPVVAALSAGASDMSGWLLLGVPGAIYASGLIESWIVIGLVVGAWLNWKFVAPRLRAYTEIANNSITVPSFFENRLQDSSHVLRIAAGTIILVFFTFYVSSGMVAGGVFFESSFGSSYLAGMLLVAGVTLCYTLFGGFLGASLTDVVQAALMFAALMIIPVVTIIASGGPGEVVSLVHAADAAHNAADPADELHRTSLFFGGSFLAIVSAAAWGLGYFGQPHIIVRFMAMRSSADAKAGRRIGISWMVLTSAGAITTGFAGLAYFYREGVTLDNPETVFLQLAQVMFHPFVAGVVLAAVLAAIMSTISSQLIVCSSALVEDIYRAFGRQASPARLVMYGRLGVLTVAVVAILLALNPDGTILDLVGFAWAGFGAAFGPLIILSLFWRRLTSAGAIAGMVAGAVVVGVWGQTDALADAMYEIVPGFIACLVVAVVVSLLTTREDDDIQREFSEMTEKAHTPASS
ncbi:Sodium/proline symporter [Mycolicibacterium phlei]|uniref:Sodium/proline symporter n=1 Tax=Mycolicibacterium phlei DSM 43239 = CCUG 21000 TaxID=1226750 RepID=A0A5N5V683_MYCPH|nr:sodium/proline symporter PutP [Mycolicibacterium phlei]VEG11171.1 Sodium/proline symporter [Mycobacteroides chelonae]AMO63073.1 Sodium/proline symporter [Mycolicibacterium phlei]KAB7756080.1 proline:sodium symporter [Mycolicibacterium phlei DSM 43239 = CCUG 21000]KXW65744.1 proline:sodium symporter [Mycolicibacterium phlei DSM 43239 = CCUG 21000]KXW68430.1 proline:sodium symporter [Mycolicibacterium phlei DSM 43072]